MLPEQSSAKIKSTHPSPTTTVRPWQKAWLSEFTSLGSAVPELSASFASHFNVLSMNASLSCAARTSGRLNRSASETWHKLNVPASRITTHLYRPVPFRPSRCCLDWKRGMFSRKNRKARIPCCIQKLQYSSLKMTELVCSHWQVCPGQGIFQDLLPMNMQHCVRQSSRDLFLIRCYAMKLTDAFMDLTIWLPVSIFVTDSVGYSK